MPELVHYESVVFDSRRWEGFAFRPDDIVLDTPPKSGTTWTQLLCAMLVLDTVELDRPLSHISPWLDMLADPLDVVVANLEAQRHRRIIKTHTPLDGVPYDERVTYLCVGRDPRDVAVSFQHHWANLDVPSFLAARAAVVGRDDSAALGPPPTPAPTPRDQLRAWMVADGPFIGPTLADVLRHLRTFWDRRHLPGTVLLHYADLQADLPGELRRLATALGIEVGEDRLQELAAAASFPAMKARADELVPTPATTTLWLSNTDFFRAGVGGQWRELLDEADLERYEARVAELVEPDLAAWAHHGRLGAEAGPLASATG